MPHSGPLLEEPIRLSNLLKPGLRDRPNEPALVSMESVWSWSDFEDKANRLAGHYFALGLQPGDRVASLMPNRGALFVTISPASRRGW